MNKLFKQVLKFGVVGGIAFVIDYSLLLLLTEFFDIHYFISASISFLVSVLFNYIASILWVFDTNKQTDKKTEFLIFIGLSIVGLAINQLIMWISVEVFLLYYLYAKLIATILVMIFNFITRKKFLE